MGHYSFLRRFAGPDDTPPTMRQLYKAFLLLGRDFAYFEEQVSAVELLARFQRRWGDLSPAALHTVARRFAPGQPRPAPAPEAEAEKGESLAGRPTAEEVTFVGPDTPEEADITFALAALAIISDPQTTDALALYLASPYAIERWLAAIGLVTMCDERALPILEPLLVEFVGPNPPQRPDLGIGYIFEHLRGWLLRRLADWNDPRAVPAIRAGLIANVRAEEIAVPDPPEPDPELVWNGRYYTGQGVHRYFYDFLNQQLFWVDQEHLFVYALGRMDAFGALDGVPMRRGVYSWSEGLTSEGEGEDYFEPCLPQSHAETFRANVWRVHMCFGALESQFCGQIGTIYNFADASELAEAVKRLLAGKFGMDEAASRRAMEDYDQAGWTHHTVFLYGWETERARERKLWKGDNEEEEEQEEEDGPEDTSEISLEDREAQDFGW